MIGFGFRASSTFEKKKIIRPTVAAGFKNIGHVAASLRKVVRQSIRRFRKPAAAGGTVHSPTGELRQSIFFATRRGPNPYAIVGPTYSAIGPTGAEHETGRNIRGFAYPRRPFMGPGLAVIGPRMAKQWAGSIRG